MKINPITIESASRNWQAIYRLQNNRNLIYALESVVRVALEKPFPAKCNDFRKSRLPQWAIPAFKGLLKWFAVAEDLRPLHAGKFDANGWRRTSYAELAKIWPRMAELSQCCIKSMLRTLEAAGILQRRSRFIAAEKKSELFIRLNAGKLLSIVADLPILKLRDVSKVQVEINLVNTGLLSVPSTAVNRPVNTSLYCSPSCSPSVPVSESVAGCASEVIRGSSGASLPGRSDFYPRIPIKVGSGQIVDVSTAAGDLVFAMRDVFSRADFTEATLKLLDRLATSPLRASRLTAPRFQQWLNHVRTGDPDPLFLIDDLPQFLAQWPSILAHVAREAVRHDYNEADVYVMQMEQAHHTVDCTAHGILEQVLRRSSETGVNPQHLLNEMKVTDVETWRDLIGRFVAGRNLQITLSPARSEELKKELKNDPGLYECLKEIYPLQHWARLDAVDLRKMRDHYLRIQAKVQRLLRQGELHGLAPER